MDTSTSIGYDPRLVQGLCRRRTLQRTLIAHVVWDELLAGMHRARHPAAESAKLEAFVKSSQIIGADQEMAVIYGELLAELERAGRRIPTNDVWIAATAVQFALPLLARHGHFGRLASLRWISY